MTSKARLFKYIFSNYVLRQAATLFSKGKEQLCGFFDVKVNIYFPVLSVLNDVLFHQILVYGISKG